MFVCPQIFVAANGCNGRPTGCRLARTRRLRIYIIYLRAHCVGVTNMSLYYNLSPALKIYHRHRRTRSSSASHKNYRLVMIFFLNIQHQLIIWPDMGIHTCTHGQQIGIKKLTLTSLAEAHTYIYILPPGDCLVP